MLSKLLPGLDTHSISDIMGLPEGVQRLYMPPEESSQSKLEKEIEDDNSKLLRLKNQKVVLDLKSD